VAEGNKQGRILESDAEKQQLIISNIYSQRPSMWQRENKQGKILESDAEKQQLII
jgi:hypothetical protein